MSVPLLLALGNTPQLLELYFLYDKNASLWLSFYGGSAHAHRFFNLFFIMVSAENLGG